MNYNNSEYLNLKRFISYSYQINSILELKPKSILEIGVGNGIVYNYLKRSFDIVSCDINKSLSPDYVCDIRKLPFGYDKFNVAVAFEVLEHIPFEDLETALMELKRVSNKYVIISVPYAHLSLKGLLNFKLPFTDKQIIIPRFWVKFKHSEEHYWELGTRGYSKKKMRNILKKHFNIINSFHPILNPYHYFLILEKR